LLESKLPEAFFILLFDLPLDAIRGCECREALAGEEDDLPARVIGVGSTLDNAVFHEAVDELLK